MPKALKKIKKTLTVKKVKKVAVKRIVPLVKRVAVEKIEKPPEQKIKIDYIFAVGRRKASIARVRYFKKGNGEITVNGKDYKKYFTYFEYQNNVTEPLYMTGTFGNGNFSIKVTGGGIKGQAESIRLGISRILVKIDSKFKSILKTKKLLTRDPRVKERKKYGLKKARRAPQWQKR